MGSKLRNIMIKHVKIKLEKQIQGDKRNKRIVNNIKAMEN